MTFIRRLPRGKSIYLYRVTNHRVKGTKKVKQDSQYMGREITVDGKTVIREPGNRARVRRIVESAPYIMYRYAEDFGIMDEFMPAISGMTNMREAARRIVELAAMDMFGSAGSIELHTGIRDGTVKENRDLINFIGSENPHVAALLQRSISKRIVKEFGSSGIVYDLSAIRYYGNENDLAEFGHYYHSNGENREINFVMAVTRDSGIPVHHRIMPGNIVSVSTVHNLAMELKDLGMHSVMIVMDRGFYSESNVKELADHSIIASVPGTLSVYADIVGRSSGIENPGNYMQYGEETIFHKSFTVNRMRYIVYYSAKRKAERIESFYSKLSEAENTLKGMMNVKFASRNDMIRSVTASINGIGRYISVRYSGSSFTYSLKRKTIQTHTSRMGFFVLLTNTMISEEDILKIYRMKDVVEKAFMRSKSVMEPLYAHTDGGTRARVFLSILGYAIVAMIAYRCNMTYNKAVETMKGIREVVYTSGSHSTVELTKDQKTMLEKLSIEL
jgi:transposase